MTEFIHSSSSSRYSIIRKLGSGSYGDIQLAADRVSGRTVAIKNIKVLNKKKNGLAKAIFREMESLRQLTSMSGNRHVSQYLDFYPDEHSFCLVMEYLPSDLATVIKAAVEDGTFLPKGLIKAYSMMMIDAIAFCHSKNIIHRDLKPTSKSVYLFYYY
jgi:serine/threonine protein kinase